MTLSPGTRLGVYEVTALIGAGGMGQVCRATDTVEVRCHSRRQRFVMAVNPRTATFSDSTSAPIAVVLNWTAALSK